MAGPFDDPLHTHTHTHTHKHGHICVLTHIWTHLYTDTHTHTHTHGSLWATGFNTKGIYGVGAASSTAKKFKLVIFAVLALTRTHFTSR